MTHDDSPNDYDSFALAYAEHSDTDIFTAHYERPTAFALLGDVAGLRVLDAGCGQGTHSRELLRRGARVTGLDGSTGLLDVARQRLGPDVALHHGDLADPLPFEDGSFDVVLASLVLHYLHDWHPTLSEFHRVLVPGGRFVMSTHHPVADHRASGADDYFETYQWSEDWVLGGEPRTMRFWHRPLQAMTDAFAEAGFRLDSINEPRPEPAASADFPLQYARLSTRPQFLFLAAHT